METVKYQFFVFLYTIYGGIIIGISYDIYRVMKGRNKREKAIASLWDIVFLAIILFICLWAIFSSNNGDRRVYVLIGFIVGFILYEKALGRFATYLFSAIKKGVVRFFATTNHLILLPFKLLYNLLWYPVLKIVKLIKKIFKDIRKIGKIPKTFITNTRKYYKLIIKKQINDKK